MIIAKVRAGCLLMAAGLLLAACGGKNEAPEQPKKQESKLIQAPSNPVVQPAKPVPLPGAVAVMIDNHPDARPQAGLNEADIVYEAMTEGGITRFMAIFSSRPAAKIGPVRSARPYFVEIARGYDLPYAHVGGSEDAYVLIGRLGLADLDEIKRAGEAYWRVGERRAAQRIYQHYPFGGGCQEAGSGITALGAVRDRDRRGR